MTMSSLVTSINNIRDQEKVSHELEGNTLCSQAVSRPLNFRSKPVRSDWSWCEVGQRSEVRRERKKSIREFYLHVSNDR